MKPGENPAVSDRRVFLKAGTSVLAGAMFFVNTYTYDNLGGVTRIEQQGVGGGNAVAEKRVDLAYNADELALFGRALTAEEVKLLREMPGMLQALKKETDKGAAPLAPKFPFDLTTARRYQKEYAERAGLPVEFTNRLGMTFVLVPPGTFLMGSPQGEPGRNAGGYDEGPRHEVTLTRPFYVGKHEVTVGQFNRFVAATTYVTDGEKNGGGNAHDDKAEWKHRPGTSWRKPGYAGPFEMKDEHPVVHVSHTDALAFCRWLQEERGAAKPKGAFGLPTESQWEWACRAGSAARYWWGDDEDTTGKVANVGDKSLKRVHPHWPRTVMAMDDGHAFPAPVGTYRANGFGLHDMLGNVWEFCSTHYGPYPKGPVTDGEDGDPKRGFAVRGGGWSNVAHDVRCASRNADPPHFCHSNLGFRVALILADENKTNAKKKVGEQFGTPRAAEPDSSPSTKAGTLRVFIGPEAKLVEPFGIDFDKAGNAHVVELSGGRVLKVDGKGRVTTIAGALKQKGDEGDGGPAEKARFNGMHNLAVAPSGDIYLADTWNRRVRKIDGRTGTISTVAGTGQRGYSGEGGPAIEAKFGDIYCVSLDPKGEKLYLADLDNRRIRVVVLASGVVSLVAGSGQKGVPKDGTDAKTAPLVDPRAVAADAKGNVYILERSGHALRVVDAAGKIQTVVGVSGKAGAAGDGGDARSATLNGPKHLCVDREGNVIIADAENHLVRKYVPSTGKIIRVAGTGKRGAAGVDGPPVQAELARPHGVTVHPNGILYIVDSDNHRVLRIDR